MCVYFRTAKNWPHFSWSRWRWAMCSLAYHLTCLFYSLVAGFRSAHMRSCGRLCGCEAITNGVAGRVIGASNVYTQYPTRNTKLMGIYQLMQSSLLFLSDKSNEKNKIRKVNN